MFPTLQVLCGVFQGVFKSALGALRALSRVARLSLLQIVAELFEREQRQSGSVPLLARDNCTLQQGAFLKDLLLVDRDLARVVLPGAAAV